ncbi:hypothetical protein Pcinc_033252 [Petrolisthes cinctipes]|uniref:Uncharacterized protein n=1 Tax=Petrolisthes cinctipes TaxID=88211 RepID=A0AAE1ESN3_PETCI|nr:hypothetical protein Pcinc_033252 [Petrolisthes cinctipes]
MEHGHYKNLMQELARECPQLYRNFTRMDKSLFEEIVERVTHIIQRKPTFWRQPIAPDDISSQELGQATALWTIVQRAVAKLSLTLTCILVLADLLHQ